MVLGTRCSREATGSGEEGQGTDRQMASWHALGMLHPSRTSQRASKPVSGLVCPTPRGAACTSNQQPVLVTRQFGSLMSLPLLSFAFPLPQPVVASLANASLPHPLSPPCHAPVSPMKPPVMVL